MIGKNISHFKILEKLGEGGMGVVYKAEDTKLDRLVAIKFLPQHLTSDSVEKERFIHEAKAASALNHANITTVYEIDEFEGQMFIVMEYCEGRTLKQIIENETLSVKKVLDIGIQVCEGLTAAHKKEIVHRDIKSDNLMVTKEGQVKIMDFGLAKLKGATKLTKTRSTLGTAAYMSPEQAQGEEVDQRSDIFSFGVVLYELLTGRLPFEGEHQAAIIYSIMNEEPQPVARFNNQVSAKLEDMVFKALAKEKEERYQHIDELLADLRRERKSLEYVKTTQIPPEAVPPRSKKKLLPFLVPASIVFILVLLFLILKPFKFEIVPEEKAIAKENSLAIMYFVNLVDPEDKDRIAQMITALLITDLSESQYMQVVSQQRLYDILKLLGKEDLKVIDKSVASEVARKAEVKWILTGNILQTEPNIVLTSDISETSTGKILTTQRITGETGEDLFSVVDKLSVQIKENLSLPEQAKKEPDRAVADVTTHSPEAYRYYLEGLDYYNKYYFPEAKTSFEKALEFDSTFAMAYYWLSGYEVGSQAKEMIDKAVKYSDKVSQKERHYIKSLAAYMSGNYIQSIQELQNLVERYPEDKYAFFLLGLRYNALSQPQEAIRQFNKVIELDPLYKRAYNDLATTYDKIGDFEKSIWAINKYISLAPDEANPYDSRADLYAWNGKIDQAIQSYKKALEIKPDFHWSLSKLGHMYLFKREYVKAESCYQELSSSSEKDTRSEGRTCLVLIPVYQGKLEEALKVLDDGIAADRMEQAQGWANAVKHEFKAFIYAERKDLNLALKEQEMYMEIYRKAYPEAIYYERDYYAVLLAENDDFQKAEEVAKALKKDIEEKDQTLMFDYWWTVGYIELIRGNFEASVTNFEKAAKDSPDFWVHFPLAKAYLEAGRLGEAVAEFEKALSRYDSIRAFFAIWAVKTHYLLGLAYEKSGWNKKAIEKYEEFLEIWKDADPGIPEVADAKERLKKLRAQS
jgi:tetratricopeptide (TPR) repeat protein/predicted Ser/Thr protein kinase